MYLHLASLTSHSSSFAPALRDALQAARADLTLDLWGTEHRLSHDQIALVVELIAEQWPRPAVCLVRCPAPHPWHLAACRLHQPLLSWSAFARWQWRQLGIPLQGTRAAIVRALCFRPDRFTLDDLVADPSIVPRSSLDAFVSGQEPLHAQERLALLPPLRFLVEHRYVIEGPPGMVRVVHPTAPL